MANGSEYELRLKAVLDTADVQQKLQQLRGGQGAQGGNGGAQAGGGGASFSNLGGLSQTMAKLNQGMAALRQSIDRLSGRLQFGGGGSGGSGGVQIVSVGGGGGGMIMPPLMAQTGRGYSRIPLNAARSPELWPAPAARPVMRIPKGGYPWGEPGIRMMGVDQFAGQIRARYSQMRDSVPADMLKEQLQGMINVYRKTGHRGMQSGASAVKKMMDEVLSGGGSFTGKQLMGALDDIVPQAREAARTYQSKSVIQQVAQARGSRQAQQAMNAPDGVTHSVHLNLGPSGRIWSGINWPGWMRYRRDPYEGMTPEEESAFRRQNMRRSMGMWLGGMYASQLFAGIGRATEGTAASPLFNAAGEGVGSALNTASLLANAGSSTTSQAVLGGLAGVASMASTLVTQFAQLSQAASEAAVKIQEMKDAQTQQARELARGTETTIHSYRAGLIQERARDAYTSYEDDARVYQMTEDYRNRREQAMRRLAGMVDPMAYATQRRNSAEAMISEGKLREGSFWHPYDQQEANNIREQAENDIKGYLQRYKNMQSDFRQMDQIFGTWNSALKEIERENQHLHDNFQDEYTRFETEEASRVAANFSAMRDAEEVFGVKWARRSSTLDAQTFANETLRNRMLGPRGQFNALSQRLDVVRRSRNDALETAFGLNRRLGVGGLDEDEIMDLQQRRDEAQSHAAHWGDVAQILAHAMQQISTHVRPPDMSNVQDLGRWGMTFNERDNRTKIYEDYLRRQCNLQQEIRDKINEGVKSETRYE